MTDEQRRIDVLVSENQWLRLQMERVTAERDGAANACAELASLRNDYAAALDAARAWARRWKRAAKKLLQHQWAHEAWRETALAEGDRVRQAEAERDALRARVAELERTLAAMREEA